MLQGRSSAPALGRVGPLRHEIGMILHVNDMGEGPVAVLVHGLFGTATNFGTVQRRLAVGRRVIAVDLRNHGRSPHDPAVTYQIMADDLFETLDSLGIERAALVGHSMGGKTVMTAALSRPDRVERLLIADIAPMPSPPRNRAYAEAMMALPLRPGLTRAEADAALADAAPDRAVRQFLLSNLRFGDAPSWRIGLAEIAAALPAIEGWQAPAGVYDGPTLVVRGERSDFVPPDARALFRPLFPQVRFVTLRDAGHWLHADVPDAFVATVGAFLRHDPIG